MSAVRTHDGGSMPAYIALPAGGRGPGIVLLQEIFGITDYLKRRARDLADLGYAALVPDLYWRMGSGITLDEDTQEGLQQAFGYLQRLDEPQAVDDAVAALEHLRSMPQTGGKAGVRGRCTHAPGTRAKTPRRCATTPKRQRRRGRRRWHSCSGTCRQADECSPALTT